MIYRWLSTTGEDVLVLPVGSSEEYNLGDPDTALVPCLVIYSERSTAVVGRVIKFGVKTLKRFASLDERGMVSS